MQVIAYTRKSTEDRQELTIEGQEAAINLVALQNGWTVISWFSDLGVSGSVDPLQRPQASKAFKAARELGCPIIVHKLDRLSRDVGHWANLKRNFQILEAEDINGTPLIHGIKSLLAEDELWKIRSRTKHALAQLKARAETGDSEAIRKIANRDAGRAVAHQKKTWVSANAGNQAKARERAELLEDGVRACLQRDIRTLQGIADCLNLKGITTARGSEFKPTTVKRLLARLSLSLT